MTVCTVVKSKGKITQNFVAFSEYMNFTKDFIQLCHDKFYVSGFERFVSLWAILQIMSYIHISMPHIL